MIGFFPTLHSDELLYSGCARYRSALGIDERHRAQRALFGDARGTSVVELPGRLGTFVARLPTDASYTVEQLLSAHTVLPYYRPFKRPDQIARAVRALTADDAGSVRMLLLGGSRVGRPAFLHYCAACVEADRRRHGVAYWHRVHQLPGVLHCPVHGTPVHQSGIRRTDRTSETRYFTLEEVLISAPEPRDLTPREIATWPGSDVRPGASVLRRLARNAAWLLTANTDGPGIEHLPSRYHDALGRLGLTRGTFVRTPELREAVVARYGAAFLTALGCSVSADDREDWVANAVRGRGRRSTLHPIHHLLLVQVAGLEIADVLAPAADRAPERAAEPVGDADVAPRTASVGRASVVAADLSSRAAGRPTGLGAPVLSDPRLDRARRRNQKIGATTPEWDAELRSLVANREVTQAAAAEALGVDAGTLKRHARRLGVWRVEWCLCKKHLPATRRAEKYRAHRDRARATYQRLRRAHPNAGRHELIALGGSDIKWLRRYDKVWLAGRQPERRRAAPSSTDALWRARDTEFVAEVDGAVSRLRGLSRPRRATLTAILRSMGRMDVLAELDRLPQTRAALYAAVESEQEFADRKLDRAIAQCRAEGVIPKPWRLRAKAGLGSIDWTRLRNRGLAALAELAGVSATAGAV